MNFIIKNSSLSFIILCLTSALSGCGATPKLKNLNHSVDEQTKLSLKKNSAESIDEKLTNELPYRAPKVLPKQYTVESKYGEEQKLGVRYYSAQERSKLKLRVKDGLLYNTEGQKLDPELDNPKHSGRSGKAIFVISLDGQFWVTFFDQRYGHIHHSSLLAAAPVLSAGELMIEDGQLLSISNASGHYKPAATSLDVALKLLKALGTDLSECERFNINAAGVKMREQKTLPPNELLKNLNKSNSN